MKIELEVPKEIEKQVKKFAKEIDWENFLKKAIAKGIEEELAFEFKLMKVKKILKKSKLSNKQIKELSEKAKENAAKKLGLV